MKKQILFLMFGIIILISCNENPTNEQAKSSLKDSVNMQLEKEAVSIENTYIGGIFKKFQNQTASFRDDTGRYTITAPSLDAKGRVEQYFTDVNGKTPLAKLPGSLFHIDKNDIIQFADMARVMKDTLANFQFFLGYNANKDSLHLIIRGVNKRGSQVDIYDTNSKQTFILECVTDNREAKNDTLKTDQIITIPYPSEKTLPFPFADRMIKAYIGATYLSKTATSFLLNADELYNYIIAADAYKIKTLDLFLAEDYDKLKLIIIGVDKDKNYLYISGDGGVPRLLEHCVPCPTCEGVIDGGRTLDH